MFRRVVVVASVTCGLLLSSISIPTSAVEPQVISTPMVTRKIYAKVSAKRVLVGKKFVLSGKISPARKNVVVKRQRKVNGAWVNLPNGSVKTNAKGVWKMVVIAPSAPGQLNYKIFTPKISSIKAITRSIQVVAAPKPVDPVDPVEPVVIPPVLKIAAFAELHPAGSLTNVWGTYENVSEIDTLEIEQLIATDWVVVSTPINRFQKAVTSSWKARISVPLTAGMHQFRLVATVGEVRTPSTPVSISVIGPELNFIDRLGPGSPSRIWGMDVARYQHETADGVGRLIDYKKSYAAGMRFVFIKASDGYVNSSGVMTGDNRAKRWLPGDRSGAQAAGMFTGFYHFPGMVETNDKSLIIKDARNEAIQAAARLASLGGYNSMDLPYVLDMEEDDLAGSGISPIATAASISLWVKTWLEEMTLRTGRKPIIYSTANYISRTLLRSDPVWTQYDLWLARYPCKTNSSGKCVTTTHMDHMDIVNQGAQPGGVAVTPWGTGSNIDWDFWQYSSSAVGKNFGIQNGSQVDVNVFRGTSAEFRAMTQTTWTPSEGDYVVSNSDVTLAATYVNANADLPVTLTVTAKRTSNGAAAVSGNLKVTNNGSSISGIKIVTAGVGQWTVTLPAAALGTVWNLNLVYTDTFDFYADNTTDFTLEIPSSL